MSNTVPVSASVRAKCKKIKMLSVGKLLASVIKNVQHGVSVEDLMQRGNVADIAGGSEAPNVE